MTGRDKDIKSLRRVSKRLKERVELDRKLLTILTARSEKDVLEMYKCDQDIYRVKIDLQKTVLTDQDLCIIISQAEGLPVVELDLAMTAFSGAGLLRPGLPRLGQLSFDLLEKISLRCCIYLTDAGLNKLLASSGAALKDLVLGGISGISGAAFGGGHLPTDQSLEKVHLPKLEVLDLSHCDNLADAGLHQLLTVSGSTLRRLDLGSTSISDAALEGVKLPRLENLRLDSCKNITDRIVQELALNNGSHLKVLVLSNTKISDGALSGIHLPRLEVLYIGSCQNLSNTGVQALLASSGASLKDLRLVGANISHAAFHGVQLPQLQKLNLCSCKQLTNTGVQSLLTSCSSNNAHQLTELNLKKTAVDGAMLADWILARQAPKLKKLCLVQCPHVTAADVARIRSLLPDCNVEKTTKIHNILNRLNF